MNWIWGAILCVIYLSPLCNMDFNEETLTLDYEKDSALCDMVENVEFYTTAPAPVIGLLIYIVIGYRIMKGVSFLA